MVRGLRLQRDHTFFFDRFALTSGENGQVCEDAYSYTFGLGLSSCTNSLFELFNFISTLMPLGLVKLSGSNNPNAKNLKVCTGECDADSQCAYGLKCFQRSHGERIPGCYGKGGGADWDYCYDPTRKHFDPTFKHSQKHSEFEIPFSGI